MKKYILLYFVLFILIVGLFPAINVVIKVGIGGWDGMRGVAAKDFYSLDEAKGLVNLLLMPRGESLDPDRVVIGEDGWLFMGNAIAGVLDQVRCATPLDESVLEKAKRSLVAWDAYLKRKGGDGVYIMLGPNKHSVYPEFLPDSLRYDCQTNTDRIAAFFSDTGLFIDTRDKILEAKTEYQVPLYYKTDTHWNNLGAYVGYRALAEHVDRQSGGLEWLEETEVEINDENKRAGGDLSAFLYASRYFVDSDPLVQVLEPPLNLTPFRTVHDDPVLIVNGDSLNKKRLLWLRDSFGEAVNPFLGATFGEIVHQHWSDAL
jgi:hypothetical protein